MKKETILKLRNGENLNLWDKRQKLFTRIQQNKREKFVCWERWVSADRRNWIKQNFCLSLKDINQVINNF